MRTVRFYTLVTLPVGVVAIVVTAKVFSLLWKCSNRQSLFCSVSSQQLRTVPLVEIQTIYIIITILSRTLPVVPHFTSVAQMIGGMHQ